MSGLFAELRRRNVVRVAIAYVALGWLVMQSADVLLPLIGVPESGLRFVAGLLLIGFPVALVVSWVYELTPEGLRRESEIDRSRSITAETGRRLDYVIVGALVLAVLVLVFDRWDARRAPGPAETAVEPGVFPATEGPPSIAVLPFTSVGTDPENEHFADGLSEEMLARLSQLEELRVIGRTSSFAFKGRSVDPREIGQQLGVAHVLDGSVRRSGDRVRVAAQLIDTASGTSIWSKTYDERLADIFAIQSNIALAVVEQLRVELLAPEAGLLAQADTENPEAHQLFLSAQSHLARRTRESTLEAERLFARAAELDPDYALALAGLGSTYLLGANNHGIRLAEQAVRLAKPLLERAVRIAPTSARVHAALGLLHSHSVVLQGEDPEAARERSRAAFERAIALNPDLPEAYYWYAGLLEDYQDFDGAIALLEKAAEIDPLSRVSLSNLAGYLYAVGRTEEAKQRLLKNIELFPDYSTPYARLFQIEASEGNLVTAIGWLRRLGERGPETMPDVMQFMFRMTLLLRRPEIARLYADTVPEHASLRRLGVEVELLAYEGRWQDLRELIEANAAVFGSASTTLRTTLALATWRAGDPTTALALAAPLLPNLLTAEEPRVDPGNVDVSALAGIVLLQHGDRERGTRILEQVLELIESRPRRGPGGYGFLDAGIFAVLGRTEEALAVLRQGLDDGWLATGLLNSVDLSLGRHPFFEGLQDDPAFREIVEALEAELAAAAATVDEAGWPGLPPEAVAAAMAPAAP